jgi:deoxyribodipyrimidine photo-lyase
VQIGRLPALPAVELDIAPGERAGHRRLESFLDDGLATYRKTRDFPGLKAGTSRLSAHLNAGTLSIRQALHAVLSRDQHDETFLSELIWREFYRMILATSPHTVSQPFQAQYADVTWDDDPGRIEAWQEGRTGFPIVDAAMAQLNQTGWMHNRLRMVVAMFLTKDLDVSWTVGERYFRRTLMDYDLASNVGGWQWSASTGTDAAPYFRIMNPDAQAKRWDPDGEFVARFLPHGTVDPIVDHGEARKRAIAKFRAA